MTSSSEARRIKTEDLSEGDWVDVRFRGRIAQTIDSPRGRRFVVEIEGVGTYVEPIPASVCKPVAIVQGRCPTLDHCKRGEPCMMAAGCSNDPRGAR